MHIVEISLRIAVQNIVEVVLGPHGRGQRPKQQNPEGQHPGAGRRRLLIVYEQHGEVGHDRLLDLLDHIIHPF